MWDKERLAYLNSSAKIAWNLMFRAKYDFTYDLMPVQLRRIPLSKRINILKAGLNFIYRRLIPWSMPIHMEIEPTNFCNLKCPVCPSGINALDRPPKAIDIELFEHLMRDVGPYLLTLSLFAWGEPLLHPHLNEILRIVNKYNVATILSTNGQNLGDKNIQESLIRNPPTYLVIAIDGLTDETNSQYRIGAKLKPVFDGVQKLAELKRKKGAQLPILHWRYIVTKHNQHELSRLPDFAKAKKFDFLSLRTLSIIDSSEETHKEIIPSSSEFRAYAYNGQKRIRRKDFICLYAFFFPAVFSD